MLSVTFYTINCTAFITPNGDVNKSEDQDEQNDYLT